MFFLLYKHTDDDVFDDFPKISEAFLKLFPRPHEPVPEHLPRISENFLRCIKISEDCRRLPRNTRRCFDNTPANLRDNLRDKLDITEIIDIFSCEDIISSFVKISYCFYQFVTTRYTTDFYIISLLNRN